MKQYNQRLKMTNRFVYSIWCDDIRQEIGNKPSLMGIYAGGITIPSTPFVLPRLSTYVCISTPVDAPLKKLVFKIVRDDGFVLTTLQQDPFDYESIQAKPIDADATRLDLMIAITLNGIEIPEGCKFFQILVETESETLEGSKLRVDINPDIFSMAPNNSIQEVNSPA